MLAPATTLAADRARRRRRPLTSPASISALSRVRESAMRSPPSGPGIGRAARPRAPRRLRKLQPFGAASGARAESTGRLPLRSHALGCTLWARCLALVHVRSRRRVRAAPAPPRAARRADRARRRSARRRPRAGFMRVERRAASPPHGPACCRSSRRRSARRSRRRGPRRVAMSSGVPE